jgi:hypothetical protein
MFCFLPFLQMVRQISKTCNQFIVKDVLRLTTEGIADLVMEIACGLHNLRVSCRHPFPTFDVLSLLSSG